MLARGSRNESRSSLAEAVDSVVSRLMRPPANKPLIAEWASLKSLEAEAPFEASFKRSSIGAIAELADVVALRA